MIENIIKFIKKYRVILISIIIALFIEIFVCNYGFFRTLINGNINLEKEYKNEDNSIIIENINDRVTSINFEYDNKLTDKVTYTLYYTSEENSSTTQLNSKLILKNGKHYINFDTHSICKSIQVKYLTETDLQFSKVILNKPNMNISIIRMLIIFISSVFVILVKDQKIYKIEYNSKSRKQDDIFLVILLIVCVAVASYIVKQYETEEFWLAKEDINKEDSILMQTEAIINGQIELMEEPSEELKNMNNPYDNTQRAENGIQFLYDVAYYDGHYYNYFGIAPIITMILPFRLITGSYTHTYIFNIFYMLIAVFALYRLYRKLINRYINKISLFNFYLGFYAIVLGSNIFTLLRGAKYDIVLTSGITFLLISMNLAISIYENSRTKYLKLILLGITSALVVLSKPNLIIYYPFIFILCLISMKNLNLNEKIKDGLFIFIPLAILGIFQMFLNYIRFDSIFEFGAKYQLTGFNMTSCMSITIGKIYAGLVEYLFKTPYINPLRFPFVFINTDMSHISINEICYENRLLGLIGIPILYAYFLKRSIMKKSNNQELNLFIELGIITSIFAIIINTCFGGICEAYSIDFKLILAIGAILILLKWIELNEKNNEINRVFFILCMITILILIPISLTTEENFLTKFASDTTAFLKNIFEFWS